MSIEAWIDVGGTFTDCIVRTADGKLIRAKTLSSGRVPISLQPLNSRQASSVELALDPAGFWLTCPICGLSEDGDVLFETTITEFGSGGFITVADDVDWTYAVRFELRPNLLAPVLAVRRLLQISLNLSLPPMTIRIGTTRGTNALLTRTGARVALLVTAPFTDLLAIGDQTRPDLFALDIVKPPPLSSLNLGVHERLDAAGNILQPLDVRGAVQQLQEAKQAGCTSLAISLMHSYRNPIHELQLLELSRQFEFEHVSVSHQLASVVEYVARTQTTVVDAYLSPVIRHYFAELSAQFGGLSNADLLVMTSAGGLIDWRAYSGKDSILSGPAGGVVALAEIARQEACAVIGLDMGGTSTDVCRVGQQLELQYESTKAGVRILTPTLPIETIAAGGGSICWFDGVSLRIGPHSAGAFPGPACYGRGGPLTITDLNLVSGRVPPGQFPFPVDFDASWRRIDELLLQIRQPLGEWSRERLVNGLRMLANEQMADAVRSVSIQQGVDPRQHALVGFGGAAGQHICEIADALSITHVIDHRDAGLLSALGMGFAPRRCDTVIPVYQLVHAVDWKQLSEHSQRTAAELQSQVAGRQHNLREQVSCECHLELRYVGTDTSLTIPWQFDSDQAAARLPIPFQQLHQQRFGYCRPDRAIELVAVRLGACHLPVQSQRPLTEGTDPNVHAAGDPADVTPNAISPDGRHFDRAKLLPGQSIQGPAIVCNAGSTLAIEPGWTATVSSADCLHLQRHVITDQSPEDCRAQSTVNHDPVLRDCYAQRLVAIATQMGFVLQQTAISVNIKQRRDFSCAVFDAGGQLLANAPHVPVHLGAMGLTVRAIRDQFPRMKPGDAFLCNDPYSGGSHLPDITLVQPIFEPQSGVPAFFVANRAHHADIGGISPGSMSISATRLEQEGVVIPPVQIAVGGQIQLDQLRQIVDESPYPPRNWEENLADIHAQLAATQRGIELLTDYAESIGWTAMQSYANHLLDAGQARIEKFLQTLPVTCGLTANRSLRFEDSLEDGTAIRVAISLPSATQLRFDFAGTGPVSTTNLNANPSIVTAAILYVLRCMIDDDMPLNEGVLRAVQIHIPPSVLNPTPSAVRGASPAVAAGNVETSQRVVDVILGAFGVCAASQGTMNNLLFGNQSFGFYETICGGAGATSRAPGASAVHTHMTNTRLTDPEVLEVKYPVRLVACCIRAGSGGAGQHIGGHGIERAIEFLQPVTLSLLTSRRRNLPFGISGGAPGAAGENWLARSDGRQIPLEPSCQLTVESGETIRICTPGGGGFGVAPDASADRADYNRAFPPGR